MSLYVELNFESVSILMQIFVHIYKDIMYV